MAAMSLLAKQTKFNHYTSQLNQQWDGLTSSAKEVNDELRLRVRELGRWSENLKEIDRSLGTWMIPKVVQNLPFSAAHIEANVKSRISDQNKWNKRAVSILRIVGFVTASGIIVAYFTALFYVSGHVWETASQRIAQIKRTVYKIMAIGATLSVMGGICLLISVKLENIELSRKDHLYNDADFVDFLSHKVNQGKYSELDLLDPELHAIYLRYKEIMANLPRVPS